MVKTTNQWNYMVSTAKKKGGPLDFPFFPIHRNWSTRQPTMDWPPWRVEQATAFQVDFTLEMLNCKLPSDDEPYGLATRNGCTSIDSHMIPSGKLT